MEPFSGFVRGPETVFRFTEEGWRRANALAAAEHLPNLSEQALRLLQSHLAAIGLRNGGTSGTPTDETRELYRELARAGLMGACHSFSRGPESVYRITEEAYQRREELLAIQRFRFTPSAVAPKSFVRSRGSAEECLLLVPQPHREECLAGLSSYSDQFSEVISQQRFVNYECMT